MNIWITLETPIKWKNKRFLTEGIKLKVNK